MGFSPRDVDAMDIWEFAACCDGYAMAHGAKPKGQEMDDDRLAELGVAGF